MGTCAEAGCGYDDHATCTRCHQRKCVQHLPSRWGYQRRLFLQRGDWQWLNPDVTGWPDHRENGELAEQAYGDFYGPTEPVCTSCLDPGVPELHERIMRIPREIQERKESALAELKRRQADEWDEKAAIDRRIKHQVVAFAQTPEAKHRSSGLFKRRWLLAEKKRYVTDNWDNVKEMGRYKVWLYSDGTITEQSLHVYEKEIKSLFRQCGFTLPE